MKSSMYLLFVLMTILTWGAYVPTIHQGQVDIDSGGRNGALRAFLFVGLAYFVLSVIVLLGVRFFAMEPWSFPRRGVSFSFGAGVLGALGALGIVFAFKFGGRPTVVPPLVFAGAPIMATFVSMTWHRPVEKPSLLFYAGIALAAAGTAMVLAFKPK